jgi:hypothetical protein
MWCHFVKASVMFKKIYYSMILSASNELKPMDHLQYIGKLILTFAPIAYFLDTLGVWFDKNTQFFSFLMYSLLINVVVGIWYHHKAKTFSWNDFFIKNIKMWFIILLAYPPLEFLRLSAGDNAIADVFKIAIQIATLLLPISKVMKNIYILSNKQYPPAWLMERLYNFERSGNVEELMGGEKDK